MGAVMAGEAGGGRLRHRCALADSAALEEKAQDFNP